MTEITIDGVPVRPTIHGWIEDGEIKILDTTQELPFRLCYVDLPWVYFTAGSVEDARGDDWNDAPYEHNAGPPYGGIKIAIDDQGWKTPDWGYVNSPWSVDKINSGAVPWLRDEHMGLGIWAGIPLDEFLSVCRAHDVSVYRTDEAE